MEVITNRRLAKVLIATIGGMVTVFLAPWAATFAFVGLATLQAPDGIAHLLWGIAGVVGLCGFWVWIFSRAPLSKRRCAFLTSLICVGIGAAVSIGVHFGGTFMVVFVCIVPAMIGLVAIGAMWLPNTALNTDAPKAARQLP